VRVWVWVTWYYVSGGTGERGNVDGIGTEEKWVSDAGVVKRISAITLIGEEYGLM
jgi:hypothetical protein